MSYNDWLNEVGEGLTLKETESDADELARWEAERAEAERMLDEKIARDLGLWERFGYDYDLNDELDLV